MNAEEQAADDFARRIERLAIIGARQSADFDLSDWIRVWTAARRERGEDASKDAWQRAFAPDATTP